MGSNGENTPASIRKEEFFESLNLSSITVQHYRTALQSSFFIGILKEEYGILDLFEIGDIEVLWGLYCKINLHPKNICNHRAYSSALMKYIRYLNKGQKVGKRIDFGKTRESQTGKEEVCN